MTDADTQGKRAKTTLSALPATRDRLAAIATPNETVDDTLNRLLDVYQSVRVRLRTAYEARTAAAQADPAAWSAGARMADALAERAAARQAVRG
ncbi:hypothetical protein [Nocardia sp. NPDC056100]|uniref:hypothetical protein n=1 Tax=Nocardia sp. NPDC056100 TaxID=3345712 RepID=UPI0035DAE9F4